jgi:hypothetical protein
LIVSGEVNGSAPVLDPHDISRAIHFFLLNPAKASPLPTEPGEGIASRTARDGGGESRDAPPGGRRQSVARVIHASSGSAIRTLGRTLQAHTAAASIQR